MILVVDDNSIARDVVTKYLTSAGFSCVLKLNEPGIAYRVFTSNQQSIEAIVTDVFFIRSSDPGIPSGCELVEMIRQYEKDVSADQGTFILATSGDSGQLQNLMQAGADVFIPKPLKKQQVVDLIKTRLHTS